MYSENPAEQEVNMAEEGVIDLMDFNMDPEEEDKIRYIAYYFNSCTKIVLECLCKVKIPKQLVRLRMSDVLFYLLN